MKTTMLTNGKRIVHERYLDKNNPNERTEDDLFSRVSGGNSDYLDLMSSLEFLPNSPTLFNMGTKTGGTLSACFVFDISDTMNGDGDEDDPNSIMGTACKAARVARAGGGVGYYLGHIRPKDALIKSVHRRACGPVAVLRFLHQIRALVTQGGRRDLAQMAVLPCWHDDVFEFVHCKDADPKALESFNISVSWLDVWVQKVAERETTNVESRLWWEQCESAWRTGCPGMLFFDTTNAAHPTPHVGILNACNPCAETPNSSDEPCSLGSLALLRFIFGDRGKMRFDFDKLKSRASMALKFMDDILDWNTFPHPNIDRAARLTRKLGLGVMGWADSLALLGIPYDTQDAVDLGREVMRTINEQALKTSIELAERKGEYPAYDMGSEANKARFPRCRNSTRTSVAPTGTIAIIAGCYSSIEPYFALEATRTTNEGIKMMERPVVWDRMPSGHVPKTADQIHWSWHVKHQAAFQEHTDLGVSKTVNLPNSATVEDVSGAYRMMHDLKCKGGTVYRDGCRSEQVLVAKRSSVYSVPEVKRVKMPDDVATIRHKFRVGSTKGYLHVGEVDGRPVEIFIRGATFGTTMSGMLDTWSMTFSNALQHGTPLQDLVRLHLGKQFEPCGPTSNKDIPFCTSIPDYVVRYLALKYADPVSDIKTSENNGHAKGVAIRGTGHLCPNCGSETALLAGCLTCVAVGCNWSRCG